MFVDSVVAYLATKELAPLLKRKLDLSSGACTGSSFLFLETARISELPNPTHAARDDSKWFAHMQALIKAYFPGDKKSRDPRLPPLTEKDLIEIERFVNILLFWQKSKLVSPRINQLAIPFLLMNQSGNVFQISESHYLNLEHYLNKVLAKTASMPESLTDQQKHELVVKTIDNAIPNDCQLMKELENLQPGRYIISLDRSHTVALIVQAKSPKFNYFDPNLDESNQTDSAHRLARFMIYTAYLFTQEDDPKHLSVANLQRIEANPKLKILSNQEIGIDEVPIFSEGHKISFVDETSSIRNKYLLSAVSIGDFQLVKALLEGKEKKVSVNFQDPENGNTPLHVAVSRGGLSIMHYLLSIPEMNINATNKNGNTALERAALNGDWEVVKHLLQQPKITLGSSLIMAVKSGEISIVQLLLQEASLNINKTNKEGMAALHVAAKYKEGKMISALLERKDIDINVVDNYGMTPLHYAVLREDLPTIHQFLAYPHVMVNTKNKWQESPLFAAIRLGNIDMIETLIVHPSVDLNLQDQDGYSPIMYALINDKLEVVADLLNLNEVNVSLPEKNGVTLLHLAVELEDEALVASIAEHPSCKIDMGDKNGVSPLIAAVKKNNVRLVEFLLQKGADYSFADSKKLTCLDYAIKNGESPLMMKLLIDHILQQGLASNTTANAFLQLLHSILAVSKEAAKWQVYMSEAFIRVVNQSTLSIEMKMQQLRDAVTSPLFTQAIRVPQATSENNSLLWQWNVEKKQETSLQKTIACEQLEKAIVELQQLAPAHKNKTAK